MSIEADYKCLRGLSRLFGIPIECFKMEVLQQLLSWGIPVGGPFSVG